MQNVKWENIRDPLPMESSTKLQDKFIKYLLSTSNFFSSMRTTFCILRIALVSFWMISTHPGVQQICCNTFIAFENTSSLFLHSHEIVL